MTPEHIEKELKLAQANIIAAQERMDAIVKELAESKPAEVEEWPKVGNKYLFITDTGGYLSALWRNATVDQLRKATNNCYRTREEAEAKSKWLANPRTEARFRLEQLEGFDVNGGFAIHYVRGEFIVVFLFSKTGGIRFTTEAQARYAVTHHAADLMLVLEGEVQS